MRAEPVLVACLLFSSTAAALPASYDAPAREPVVEPVFRTGFVTAFLFEEDGRIVYADIYGPVARFDPVSKTKTLLFNTSAIRGPEWGLTGLAKDERGAFYTMYTTGPPGVDPESDDVLGELRVSRWVGTNETIIFTTDATRSHNGGRLLWHDGTLFVTVGEHTRGTEPASKRLAAQDPGSLAGKVLRMLWDGSPAPGNPAETDIRFHPLVYSYGHRNPFGIAWDEERDVLVLSDPAQDRNEEINHVAKGANLGWPLCVGPCVPPNATMVDPIVLYPTTITPVGMTVHGRDYYVGGFNHAQVRRVFETEAGWTDEIVASLESGVLDVHASPDGSWIYVGGWDGLWRFSTARAGPDGTPSGRDPSTSDDEDRINVSGLSLLTLLLAAAASLAAFAWRRRRAPPS